MKKYTDSFITFGKSIVAVIGLLAALYAFHKQVIVSDLKDIFASKDAIGQVELEAYPKIKGEELERRVLNMETRIHEDIVLIQSDIKTLLKRE